MFLASDLGGYAAVAATSLTEGGLRNGLPRQCAHWLAMTGFFNNLRKAIASMAFLLIS